MWQVIKSLIHNLLPTTNIVHIEYCELEIIRQILTAVEKMKKNCNCISKCDLVLVEKTKTAYADDLIVAHTDPQHLFWENDKPRLHAKNKTYTETMLNFYPRDLTIQEIALKVIKDNR